MRAKKKKEWGLRKRRSKSKEREGMRAKIQKKWELRKR